MTFNEYQDIIIDSDVNRVEVLNLGIVDTECDKIVDSVKHILLYAMKFESLIDEDNEGTLKLLINSLSNG